MRRIKAYAATLLLLSLTWTWTWPAQAQQTASPREVILRINSHKASINGREVELVAAPVVVNGTTMVPLRFVAEAFGLEVTWDAANKKITIGGEQKIAMRLGSSEAVVNGQTMHLPVPPMVRGGTSLVPLRFIAEALNRQVEFNPTTKEILIRQKERPPVAVIVLDKQRVMLGEKVTYTSASYSPDGLPIVEERWTNPPPWPAPGKYTLTLEVKDSRGLWSQPAKAVVEVLPPPNRPPVARFQVTKTVVAQGERIDYVDDSYDPDGDEIVEREWTNKREVFFTAGPQTVTLRVKDARGLWSEPYSVTIIVTEERLMDEVTYNLRYALPREKFTIPGRKLREFPAAQLKETAAGPSLILSNSPEKVVRPGILYRDTVEGQVRVFYWHANGMASPLRVFLLAENTSASPARIRILREGVAGPEKDVFGIGRKALQRYFGSTGGQELPLAPGEMLIINSRQYRPVGPDEVVHGIFDLAVEGEVTLAVVALPLEANIRQAYPDLEPLPADNVHDRGTFRNADRLISGEPPVEEPATFIFPGDQSPPLTGYDAMTGQPTLNRGNYGVLYRLQFKPAKDLVLLLNPRGGGLAGAVKVNELLVPMPRVSFGMLANEVIKAGLIAAGQEAVVYFTPAGGTSLPLNLLLWPLP